MVFSESGFSLRIDGKFSMVDSNDKIHDGESFLVTNNKENTNTIIQFIFNDFESPKYEVVKLEENEASFVDENGNNYTLTKN